VEQNRLIPLSYFIAQHGSRHTVRYPCREGWPSPLRLCVRDVAGYDAGMARSARVQSGEAFEVCNISDGLVRIVR